MRLRVALSTAAGLLAALAAGCSTAPMGAGRQGLFDRLSQGDRGSRVDRSYASIRGSRLALRWPLKDVLITSPFGQRGGEFHEGVDLRAKLGTPVLAAQDGTVIYAGKQIRGYGNLVIVRHASGINTVYAHNSRLMVHAGEKVRKGQKIAYSGQTGKAIGPHLHFEVRSGVAAIDPIEVLPVLPAARPMGATELGEVNLSGMRRYQSAGQAAPHRTAAD